MTIVLLCSLCNILFLFFFTSLQIFRFKRILFDSSMCVIMNFNFSNVFFLIAEDIQKITRKGIDQELIQPGSEYSCNQ